MRCGVDASVRLLVDIDGTLRNVWPSVNTYILKDTGVELPDTWPVYDIARQMAGDVASDAAFAAVCGRYDDMSVWYPGAWSAMVELRRAGVEPVFCTFNPWRQARSIARELAPYYGAAPHVERVLSSHNKLKVARRVGAVGIIDDKPSTLEAFNAAGLFTATLDHKYNQDVDVDCRFFDWRRVNLKRAMLESGVWWQERLFESGAV